MADEQPICTHLADAVSNWVDPPQLQVLSRDLDYPCHSLRLPIHCSRRFSRPAAARTAERRLPEDRFRELDQCVWPLAFRNSASPSPLDKSIAEFSRAWVLNWSLRFCP